MYILVLASLPRHYKKNSRYPGIVEILNSTVYLVVFCRFTQ